MRPALREPLALLTAVAATLLVSGIIGVSYVLLTGVGASLGYGGSIPPVVGGWGPTAIVAGIAGWLARRLWRRL